MNWLSIPGARCWGRICEGIQVASLNCRASRLMPRKALTLHVHVGVFRCRYLTAATVQAPPGVSGLKQRYRIRAEKPPSRGVLPPSRANLNLEPELPQGCVRLTKSSGRSLQKLPTTRHPIFTPRLRLDEAKRRRNKHGGLLPSFKMQDTTTSIQPGSKAPLGLPFVQ